MKPVKGRQENNIPKSLEIPDSTDGEAEVIEIKKIESNAYKITGPLKNSDLDSVDLQHVARDIWRKENLHRIDARDRSGTTFGCIQDA